MPSDLRGCALAASLVLVFALHFNPRAAEPPLAVLIPDRVAWRLVEPTFGTLSDSAFARERPAMQFPLQPAAAAPPRQTEAAALPDWITLLDLADGGDPHASCQLANMLEDCRMATAVGEMVETQISVAASNSSARDADANDIAALEVSVDPLRARCATVPAELVSRGWTYLLRAAIAGHEPSMFRFVVDLPVDPRASAETSDAWAVYRDNAGLFVGHLLQRASPDALALAFRAAQGGAFVGDRPIQPRDPAAVVRLGTALVALREADAASEDSVERAQSELSASESAHARAEGRRMADRWISLDAQGHAAAPLATSRDECSGGWPGMRSEYTAYSF